MTFKPDSWALCSSEDGDELVYISAVTQVCLANSRGASPAQYLQVFSFPLDILEASVDANTVVVDIATFQRVLYDDSAQHQQLCSDFTPSRCPLRGRWLWTAKVFDQWFHQVAVRAVHLSNISGSTEQLVFVFR